MAQNKDEETYNFRVNVVCVVIIVVVLVLFVIPFFFPADSGCQCWRNHING